MKHKNILLFGLVFLMLCSFVSANIPNVDYSKMIFYDEFLGSSLNTSKWLTTLGTGGSVSISGNKARMTVGSNGDVSIYNASIFKNQGSVWSIETRVSSASVVTEAFMYIGQSTTKLLDVRFISDGTIKYYDGLLKTLCSSCYVTNDSIKITYNNSVPNLKIYINNVLKGTITSFYNYNYDDRFYLGTIRGGVTGRYNDFEYIYVYNGTSIPLTITTYSTITAKDIYSNASINTFSVKFNNTNYYTSNGTITLPIQTTDTNLWNITFFNMSNYFNRTYTNYDFSASGNLEGELSSTNTTIIIKFFGTNITANVSNTNLTDWNYSKSFIQANGIFNEPFTAGTNRSFQIKCNRQVFETRNFTLDIDSQSNDTFIVYVNDTQNKLRFLDATNSSPISEATITIEYPSGETITRTTNSTGHINFSYINSDNELDFGNYTIDFNKLGYTSLTIIEEINSSNVPIDETYNISRVSINVNIYDRETGNLLTNNVSLYFLNLFNTTTNTGSYSKANVSIIPSTYTIQALSNGYGTEQRTFTYTAQENVTINFYLLNLSSTNAGTLFVNTLTSFYTIITEAQVILYEYSPTELSYVAVSECLSNINGECAFNIELNSKTYYISATKTIEDNVFFASTSESGEIILTDEEVRNLILIYTEEFEILNLDNLIISIEETFNNNISNILVNFRSIDGTDVEVCVNYYLSSNSDLNLVQSDCLESLASLQNIDAFYSLNRSNSYIARVILNDNTIIQQFNYPKFLSSIEENFDNSFIGIIILVLWSGSLALCLYLKNITLFGTIGLFLSWVEVGLFPSFSIVALSVFRTIISIIIIYTSRKIQDTE